MNRWKQLLLPQFINNCGKFELSEQAILAIAEGNEQLIESLILKDLIEYYAQHYTEIAGCVNHVTAISVSDILVDWDRATISAIAHYDGVNDEEFIIEF